MTEYELQDLLTGVVLGTGEAFSIYISLMVAYLVAVYLAGRKIGTAQLITVSALFTVAASIMVWAMYSYFSRAIPISDALEAINPGVNYGAQPLTRSIIVSLMVLGILACLKFTWDVRHGKADEASPSGR